MTFRRLKYSKQKGKKKRRTTKYEKANKTFSRVVDRRMRDAGEIDFAKRKIRVNPRKLNKGGITDTVMHENLHERFPKKTEAEIRKMTKSKLKKMSMKDMGNMLRTFKETKKKVSHYKTD